MSEEKKESSELTLTQFIENNHNLISTLAIFAALSTFASSLSDKLEGRILSFLLFSLALLVGVEITGNFRLPCREKLRLFQELFLISILMFAVMWIQRYYPYLLGLLLMALMATVMILVFGLCQYAIRWTVSKTPWLKTKSQRTREVWIPMVGAMVVMVLGFVALQYLKVK